MKAPKAPKAAPAPSADLLYDPMNKYARRVWDGQSPDLPYAERKSRIEAALIDQGWGDSLDKLVLPPAGE